MPIQVDPPSGVGSVSDWWPGGPGATSVVQAVQTNDGDNSLIYRESGGAVRPIQYTFPLILGVTDPVTAASLVAIVRWWNGPVWDDGELRLIWNSVQGSHNWHLEVSAQRPNYVPIFDSMAGAQLTLAAVNGEHGIYLRGSSSSSGKLEYWITQVYRSVTFTYLTGSAGEFEFLIGSLVGAFIGSGLLLREMPRMSAFMRRRFRIWLRPDEYEPAWREWRARKGLVAV